VFLPTTPKYMNKHPKSVCSPICFAQTNLMMLPGSVADPVVKADKEANVDQKICSDSVIGAFRGVACWAINKLTKHFDI
jgi:hypothetical protein